jgi:hypothetical protein
MSGGTGGGEGENGFVGQLGITDRNSEFNAQDFQVKQRMGEARTLLPVKIVAVHGGGTDGAPPTVDVQPLVKMQNGRGKTTSHDVIYGIPVMRLQRGKSAVIMDPVKDDIGFIAIADRDISSLKQNKGKESNPGSFRRHHPMDGIYMGQILNDAKPEQFIHFHDDGVKFKDKHDNVFETSKEGFKFNGVKITKEGAVKAPGDVTAGDGSGDKVSLQKHIHGTTPKPTPE